MLAHCFFYNRKLCSSFLLYENSGSSTITEIARNL